MIDLERELAAALMSPTIMAALEALLRRVVREELARQRTTDELVGVAQAAQLLSMTPAAVAKAAQRGGLPCVRIGRRLRFRRAELVDRASRNQGGTR